MEKLCDQIAATISARVTRASKGLPFGVIIEAEQEVFGEYFLLSMTSRSIQVNTESLCCR